MVSHPPGAYPGVVLMMVAGVQERKRKHACDSPTCQSKSYGQALSWGRTAYPKGMDLGRHEQMGATSELHLPQKALLLALFVEEMEAGNTVPLGHWSAPCVSLLCSFLVIYYMGWGCFPISCISSSFSLFSLHLKSYVKFWGLTNGS